jgi:thymine-DNA glycosylase
MDANGSFDGNGESAPDETPIKFEEDSPRPTTFAGRLALQNFMFESQEPVPRRSPRLSRTPGAPSPSPSTPAVKLEQTVSRSSTASPSKSAAIRGVTKAITKTKTKTKTKKRARPSSGYAPPSTYAHLPLLPDAITENLLVLFVGLNPGIQTAVTGHAYAHPSNLFWKLLHSSGVTPRLCRADEDREMPALYSLGLTNIVGRPSRNGSELSRQEMDDGVAALEEKAARWRPETMCIVGKSIWESIWRVRHGGRPVGKDFRYGWQDKSENMGVVPGEWEGASVFVASSTSGLAATLSPAEKQRIWSELGSWVMMRRAQREAES